MTGDSEDGEDSFEGTLVHRRINRWMLGLSFLPLLGAFFAPGTLPLGLPLSGVALIYVLIKRPAPLLHARSVRIEPGVLRIGNDAIARSTLRDAQLVPGRDGKLFVRITRKRLWPTDLGVADRPEGRRVLRALGFDASQTVARFWIISRLWNTWAMRSGFGFVVLPLALALALMLLGSAPALFAVAVKATALILLAAVAALAIPTRIDVGADGVLLRWIGPKRFLPLKQIVTVKRDTDHGLRGRFADVRITMAGGDTISLPMGDARWNDERADALVERIREAIETHARGNVAAASALLGRRALTVRDWIRELRAIGAGANADLRTAPLNPEDLWQIVESHGAEPEERAAAAVALGPSLDASGRGRLRVAVDAVADERLRIAVEAAATEDDAKLEEALGEVCGAPSDASNR